MILPGASFVRFAAAFAAIFAAVGIASGQAWPNKPVHIVSPFTSAGPSDTAARLVGTKLSEFLGQPIVVENRPGASGALGTSSVVRAAPDGYTLLMSATSSHISPYLLRTATFDPLNDLVPIVSVGSQPFYLMINAQLPAKNLAEFIALAKKNPGKYTYATPGLGTLAHLCVELFKSQTGVDLVHVPYKGSAQVVTDLMAGHIDMTCNVTPVRAPQVRLLAITSAKRASTTPEVPTTDEAGLANFRLALWIGLFGPAKLPVAIVDRLNREVQRIVVMPDFEEQLKALNIEFAPNTPAEFAAYLRADTPRWEKVIRDIGVKVD